MPLFYKINDLFYTLNSVLEQLKDKTEEAPLPDHTIFWHAKRLYTSSNRDKRAIIEKLIKDGYAGRMENEAKYFITFEGLLFLLKGGYVGQQKDIVKKRFYLSVSNVFIFFASLIGGVYAGIEIWKFFFGKQG
jgi:hypothetical protein